MLGDPNLKLHHTCLENARERRGEGEIGHLSTNSVIFYLTRSIVTAPPRPISKVESRALYHNCFYVKLCPLNLEIELHIFAPVPYI